MGEENTTDRRPLSGRTSREDEAEETGSRGNDTTKGKQRRSVAFKKHSGRRAALHNREKKTGEATKKINE